MTVCIAAMCNKCKAIVMASDTMLTSHPLSIEFETKSRKMTHLTPKCVALTSGNALAYTELFDSVRYVIEKDNIEPVKSIVEVITENYQKLRKKKILEVILYPLDFDSFDSFYSRHNILHHNVVFDIQGKINDFKYGLSILLGGLSGGFSHIYVIDDPGFSVSYNALGFCSIGSGAPHALTTLIARECHPEKDIEEVLLIVYDAKKVSEKAPGVGSRETDLCILKEEVMIQFPRNKLSELDKIHKVWIQQKNGWKESLSALLKEVENEGQGETPVK